jgi:hypothetical protein
VVILRIVRRFMDLRSRLRGGVCCQLQVYCPPPPFPKRRCCHFIFLSHSSPNFNRPSFNSGEQELRTRSLHGLAEMVGAKSLLCTSTPVVSCLRWWDHFGSAGEFVARRVSKCSTTSRLKIAKPATLNFTNCHGTDKKRNFAEFRSYIMVWEVVSCK